MRWDQRMGVKQQALLGVATLKKMCFCSSWQSKQGKAKKNTKQFYKLNNVLRS
jgi:hypothetical protein